MRLNLKINSSFCKFFKLFKVSCFLKQINRQIGILGSRRDDQGTVLISFLIANDTFCGWLSWVNNQVLFFLNYFSSISFSDFPISIKSNCNYHHIKKYKHFDRSSIAGSTLQSVSHTKFDTVKLIPCAENYLFNC